MGEEMHGHVIKEGLLGKDILLGSAVVDMYTKCGAMFDKLPIQDVLLECLNFRICPTWSWGESLVFPLTSSHLFTS